MMFFKSRPLTEGSGWSGTVEHDGLMEAIHESMCEYEFDVAGKLSVGMSNVYEMYIFDSTRTTEQKLSLMEGFVGDAVEKIKNFFKKIWEKIKSWWNSVVKYFQTMFSSNKKFIEKFKDEIEGKDTSKFTFTGYKYSGRDNIEALKKATEASVAEAKGFFAEMKGAGKGAEYEGYKDRVKAKKKEIDSKWMKLAKAEAADGDPAAGSVSKFQTAFKKHVRGGSEKKEIKDFKDSMSLSDMIDLMENGNDKLDEIKDLATTVSEAAADYADEIDKAKGALDKDLEGTDKSHATTLISSAADVAKYTLSYGTAACNTSKELVSEMISQASSVCRSLARYTPAKEGYSYSSRANKTSLFEAFSAGF